jgi:very-short-patch-repair endonuclease
MRPEEWRAITALAQQQGGLVTSAQLHLSGASPKQIAELIQEGQLLRIRKGVLGVAGVPPDARTSIRAASLASPDAVVSHRSAGWLHGLLTRRPGLVDLTTSRRPIRAIGVLGHQADVPSAEVVDHGGIPVTSVVRTLIDLMASLPPDWVERLVHDAVMRRLCEYDEVREAAGRRPDECGPAMVGILTGLHGTTPLEAQWDRIIRAAGLPEPMRQFQVVLDGHVYVLDFAWPEPMVVFEVNGFDFHRTRDAFDRDHEKVVALQAAGWKVVSASSKTPPATVLAALRQNLAFSTTPGVVEKAGG